MRFRGGGIGHRDVTDWEDDYEFLKEGTPSGEAEAEEPEDDPDGEQEDEQNIVGHAPHSDSDSSSEEPDIQSDEVVDPEEMDGEQAILRGVELEELCLSDEEVGSPEPETSESDWEDCSDDDDE